MSAMEFTLALAMLALFVSFVAGSEKQLHGALEKATGFVAEGFSVADCAATINFAYAEGQGKYAKNLKCTKTDWSIGLRPGTGKMGDLIIAPASSVRELPGGAVLVWAERHYG